MMKKLFSILFAMLFAITAMAVPAKKFVRTVSQPDGTTVDITLVGDEYFSYYMTVDGVPVMETEQGAYCYARCEAGAFLPTATLAHDVAVRGEAERTLAESIKAIPVTRPERANQIAEENNSRRARRAPNGPNRVGTSTNHTGNKRGIIILVNYTDKKMVHTQQEFDDQMNKNNYNKGGHIGSLSDYFYDQSYGQLNIDFDVVGPYTVSQNMAFYGAHSASDSDKRPGQMVAEAVRLADPDVDFSKYDWNGDRKVDQIFVIYAGYAEAQGGPQESIWPHEWSLTSAYYSGMSNEGAIYTDGVTIDTYACSSELASYYGTNMAGIGTAAHEFSHCMGLPDFYDTDYSGGAGMDDWSLMCSGSYNSNACIPAPYTSYERWFSGWMEPVELNDPCFVKEMKHLVTTPEAYIIYNQKNKNEYYLLENHQTTGNTGEYRNWDRGNAGHGMLVMHVDYNRQSWQYNTVNDDPSHQRMTYIPANGKMTSSSGSLYPGTKNNRSLTNTSSPAAKLYNKNTDGSNYMNRPIENITEVSGMINFKFNGGIYIGIPEVYEATNVTDSSFTAHWSEIPGAETYTMQVYEKDKFGKDTIFCEDIASNEAFSSRITTDVSTKINNYLTSGGWSGLNLFIDEQRLRLGTSTKAGKLQSKLLPAPQDGKIRVNIGIQKYLTNATNFYVRVLDENSSIVKSITLQPTEDAEIHHLTIDSISTDFKLVFLTQSKQAFITYIDCLDNITPLVLDGLTETSYDVTGLEPNTYVYRVKALATETEGLWSEPIEVVLQGTTAIENVAAPSAVQTENVYYNLSGQRVARPQKGIFILGNKKVVK